MPTKDVLRELFLKSGNLCAFPGCNSIMMNSDGAFIGQICHIEAAEKNGQRYNANMSDEERRAFSNLMLMCYPHHQATNDVVKFPTQKLQDIKMQHENLYSDPGSVLLRTLEDHTSTKPLVPQTLKRMSNVLKWDLDDCSESIPEIHSFIQRLSAVPREVRKFAGLLANRYVRLAQGRGAIGSTSISLPWADVKMAFGVSDQRLIEYTDVLELHNIGGRDHNEQPVVYLRDLASGWPIWEDLAAFADKESLSIERFTVDLAFDALD